MVIKNIDFEKYNKLADKTFYRKLGKVVNVVGLTIESAGPDSKLGDLCRILPEAEGAKPIMAEVVGFRDKKTLLMPYDSVDGIGLGCVVENTGDPLTVTVSEKLLGKTVNGLGIPIDGDTITGVAYPVEAAPPDPMSRAIIDQVLPLGVKAVDGMITVGKGQRIGIFAGSGVGKSTLMGMFARNTKADINVIALIGERGREVREFIERDLGEEGMRRSVVVVATSDRPALERNKAAKTATAIAEYFRDRGKDVLLMMDSLTRFSMAQREIGLASGEPPVTRGYPPCPRGAGRRMPARCRIRLATNRRGYRPGSRQDRLYYGIVYRPGRWRRFQRTHHGYGEKYFGRSYYAGQKAGTQKSLPCYRYFTEYFQMYEPDRSQRA